MNQDANAMKQEAKKDPENFAKIAKVTRIFLGS